MQAQMLAPAAVLVAWTLVMQLWMIASRFPALRAAGIDLKKAAPGGRGQDLDGRLPPPVMWKSHNYTHLMEQPTIFYAVVAILAIAGPDATSVMLAWAYTIIRIVHSLWQSLVNRIPVRFVFFALSSVVLIALAIRALQATVFAGA
ncbi:MAPEG family protein [Tsuneonella sp. HG222]